METATIFCDGASKGNPGKGGWGAVISLNGEVVELGGNEPHTTNNRMELSAALEALRFVSMSPDVPATVHTDSSYVINGITKWTKGWQRNGWLTKEKKEVLNRDLWEALVAITDARSKTTWKYVGGHVGIRGNERADEIASAYATGDTLKLYRGPKAAYPIDLENIDADAILKKAKSSSKTRSKAKAYSYISAVGGVVKTHATWSECEARVRGKAARFKKATSPEEERAIIASFSK